MRIGEKCLILQPLEKTVVQQWSEIGSSSIKCLFCRHGLHGSAAPGAATLAGNLPTAPCVWCRMPLIPSWWHGMRQRTGEATMRSLAIMRLHSLGRLSGVDGGVNPRINGDDRKAGTRFAACDQPLLAIYRSDANGCPVALCQRRQPPKAGAVGQRLQRVAGQPSLTIKSDGWFPVAAGPPDPRAALCEDDLYSGTDSAPFMRGFSPPPTFRRCTTPESAGCAMFKTGWRGAGRNGANSAAPAWRAATAPLWCWCRTMAWISARRRTPFPRQHLFNVGISVCVGRGGSPSTVSGSACSAS